MCDIINVRREKYDNDDDPVCTLNFLGIILSFILCKKIQILKQQKNTKKNHLNICLHLIVIA